MKNILNDGFTQLYGQSQSLLPAISFKADVGDFKRAVESTVDQIIDEDAVSVEPIPSNVITDDTDRHEPAVGTQDPLSIGEKIIGEEDDPVSENDPDGTPAGYNPAAEMLFMATGENVSLRLLDGKRHPMQLRYDTSTKKPYDPKNFKKWSAVFKTHLDVFFKVLDEKTVASFLNTYMDNKTKESSIFPEGAAAVMQDLQYTDCRMDPAGRVFVDCTYHNDNGDFEWTLWTYPKYEKAFIDITNNDSIPFYSGDEEKYGYESTTPRLDEFLSEEEDGRRNKTEEDTAELCYHLLESPVNEYNQETIEDAAMKLASSVSHVYSDIKTNVTPVVEQLLQEIKHEAEFILEGNGSNILATTLQVKTPEFSEINWNLLSRLGTANDIISNAKQVGKLRSIDVLNFASSRSSSHRWLQQIEATDIPPVVGDNIVTRVNTETVKTADTTDEVGPANIVAQQKAFIDQIKQKMEASTEAFGLNLSDLDLSGGTERLEDKINNIIHKMRGNSGKLLDRINQIRVRAKKIGNKSLSGDARITGMKNAELGKLITAINKATISPLSFANEIEDSQNDANAFKHMQEKIQKHLENISDALSITRRQLEDKPEKAINNAFSNTYSAKELGYTTKGVLSTLDEFENSIKKYDSLLENLADTKSRYIRLAIWMALGWAFWLGPLLFGGLSLLGGIINYLLGMWLKQYIHGSTWTEDQIEKSCIVMGKIPYLCMNVVINKSLNMFDNLLSQAGAGNEQYRIEEAKEQYAAVLAKLDGDISVATEGFKDFIENLKNSFTSVEDRLKLLNTINLNELAKVKPEHLKDIKVPVYNYGTYNQALSLTKTTCSALQRLVSQIKPNNANNGKIRSQIAALDVPTLGRTVDTLIGSGANEPITTTRWNLREISKLIKEVNDLQKYVKIFEDFRNNEALSSDSENKPVLRTIAHVAECLKLVAEVGVHTGFAVIKGYQRALKESAGKEDYSLSDTDTLYPAVDDGTSDKQTHAHSVEEAFAEATESLMSSLNQISFDLSTGVTSGVIDRIDQYFTGASERITEMSSSLENITPAELGVLSKVKQEYLLNEEVLSVPYDEQLDQIDNIRDISQRYVALSKEADRVRNKNEAWTLLKKSVNLLNTYGSPAPAELNVSAMSLADSGWTPKNVQHVLLGIDAAQDITNAIKKITTAVLKIDHEADNNVIQSLLKYSGIISTYVQRDMSIVSEILEGYRRAAVKQSIKAGDESLINPHLDEFLTEEEDGRRNKKDTETTAQEVYNIISNQASYYRFMKTMFRAVNAPDTAHQVAGLLDIVSRYPKVLNLYRHMDFNISDIDAARLKKNSDAVQDILYCVGLHLLVARKYFNENNVLILDDKHLNPDAVHTFKKGGGTTEDINLYYLNRHIIPQHVVPNLGIRTGDILNSKEKVQNDHNLRVSAAKRKLTDANATATLLAYKKVLDKYLKNTPQDKIPAGMTLKNFVETKYNLVTLSSNKLNATDGSIDSCLYKFLLDLWYADKPAYGMLFNNMNKVYQDTFSANVEVGTMERDTADAKAISNILINFLFDHCVERKK